MTPIAETRLVEVRTKVLKQNDVVAPPCGRNSSTAGYT